nr:putative transposase, MuDR, plant, MULE transposase domain protein [Ipomoea batatas]
MHPCRIKVAVTSQRVGGSCGHLYKQQDQSCSRVSPQSRLMQPLKGGVTGHQVAADDIPKQRPSSADVTRARSSSSVVVPSSKWHRHHHQAGVTASHQKLGSRYHCGAAPLAYDGEDSSVFTIKLHIGGNLVWKPKVDYRDGFVEYFDYFNCDEGSLLDLRRMVKQLRFCDKKVQFWVKVKGKPKSRKTDLRKVTNDADILVLNLEVPRNKELDIYVEHLYDDQWDYDVEISSPSTTCDVVPCDLDG